MVVCASFDWKTVVYLWDDTGSDLDPSDALCIREGQSHSGYGRRYHTACAGDSSRRDNIPNRVRIKKAF